uniref:Uncharacterized protein n=1 Tax=Picea sitchensis TaxID=3332 RepID=A0A6B9XT34_PICSI|nr:hypothetical protein Q903MT_gene4221 [Picea sitchensis]
MCILSRECRTMPLRQAHTYRVAWHLKVGNTLLNLHMYVYWLCMDYDVANILYFVVLPSQLTGI